ncbi:DNA mismatch repair protein MutS [Enterovirga sp.]|uniref:DNA mismatch repair protein MutS n=1 Tax=Enterovirga sp. TaxID=2026350 RepID=UPI002C6960EE|nr:DNA mismatch repair protein MutS [Enterovirga sp.]HMO30314.1 DNA mismatch repair protein MutS [Enterovirga sp.]
MSAEPVAPAAPSPMMAQYLEIKAANSDCLLFYRMGDFYELFFQDAEVASRALGIVLTKRGKHAGEDIPMCGVPLERGEDALARLIAAGHRVAVCEQTEDPAEARKRGGKSVVRRAVVRLVTPGTLTEERLLDPGRPSILAAVARRREGRDWRYGLAGLDVSTGRFTVVETDRDGLATEIARFDPREIVVPDAIREDPDLRNLWRESGAAITPVAREGIDAASAERRLREHFGIGTLDSFGSFGRAEITAAGAALAYLERTQYGARPRLSPPARQEAAGRLLIDPATRANLELLRTTSGERTGSLLDAVDRTVTAAGSRLLAERLSGPLTDPAAIADRLDAVALLAERSDLREALIADLKAVPDFARALGRVAVGRGGPRDLACLRDGLAAAAAIGEILGSLYDPPTEIEAARWGLAGLDPAPGARLAAALGETLPLRTRDGGFIRDGYDPALDEARALGGDTRKVVAGLQTRYAEATGIRTLRIKHNNMLGYFVEVPAAAGEALLREPGSMLIHRQTMAGAMRFTSTELGELEARIASAGERALGLELDHFEALSSEILAAAGAIEAAAEALARLDVAAGLAVLAADLGWSRPRVEHGLAFRIEGGRHPVVEAALKREGAAFVPNDCRLGEEEGPGRILLVTGPNMGGKSTYLRQAALIAVLAQSGSFVPARAAEIGIVDRLFSRVGAADDLARGRSTFMVEMVETAAILNQATARSLVILDEIGRGTATFDGLSIAWASIEHLHDAIRCRALFATHYHELTTLADRLPRLGNATLRVAEYGGDVVFLHEVVAGAADRSYGLQVARLAGLPKPVVARARKILVELERSDREHPRTALIDDLPLFAAARPAEPPAEPDPDPCPDPLREALAAIDPDSLAPRAALEALYRLKGLQ